MWDAAAMDNLANVADEIVAMIEDDGGQAEVIAYGPEAIVGARLANGTPLTIAINVTP